LLHQTTALKAPQRAQPHVFCFKKPISFYTPILAYIAPDGNVRIGKDEFFELNKDKYCLGIILFLAAVALPFELPQTSGAPSHSALDGLGVNATCRAVYNCEAQLLTTTRGHDLIVVLVDGYGSASSIIDNSGLSFAERVSYPSTGIFGVTLSEYYAIATSPLKSDNITVMGQFAQCCQGMQVLAIHVASTPSIFDPNPSIPAAISCPGSECGNCSSNFNQGVCSASIQTSTIDFVITSTAINDAGPCGASEGVAGVSAFTTVSFSGVFEVDYAITSVPQTAVAFNCIGTDATAIVMDAIAIR